MKRTCLLAALAGLLFLAGCPDPFIHDPVVVDVNRMPVVQPRGTVQAIPPSEAPPEYYMHNNRFYVVIDEPDYVYKDEWEGFGPYYRELYDGLDPLPYALTAYRLSGYAQYGRHRPYEGGRSGDQLRAPSLRRMMPPILFREGEKD